VKIYIGYDEREHEAAVVAEKSLHRVSKGQLKPEFIRAGRLAAQGLLTRISDHRGGQDYDLISNAKKSTRFAVSRFLTPMLCQQGFALFVDCDVVFREDPREMLTEIKSEHAVSVVKHDYRSSHTWKMVDQVNTPYARKNWSSVMLFNCDHKANRRLSLRDVNERPGLDLHQFYWLGDDEIGALDPRWNWLVNEQDDPSFQPDGGGIAHFTLGGPWIKDWKPAKHDEIWMEAWRG
jgi:lipopolysaccharide biosynthesis glycosyltransferase